MWIKLLLSTFLLVLLSEPALSQTPTKKDAGSDGWVQIDFDGGTLDSYLAVVRKKLKDANIVVDGVGNMTLPKISLQKVNLPLALEWIPKTADARKHGLLLQSARTGRDTGEVFVFTATQTSTPREPAPEERSTKPYHLDTPEDGESSRKPDVITKAVEDHLKMQFPDEKAVAVTYNAESKLMTVKNATRTQIALADRVKDEMTRGQVVLGPVIQNLQAEVEKLKKRVADLEKKNEK
jgi:hypothetical protein